MSLPEPPGYLTLDAGVVARDASGHPVENISIVAAPLESIPSSGEIGGIEHPQALYVFNCIPEGATFSPPITLTFTLTDDEWNLYGSRAEVGWFNSTSGEWEILAGVPDPDERTITIQISHFSTYALFADDVPEVPLPTDGTGIPSGSSDGSSLWLWGGFFIVVIAAGVILFSSKKKEELAALSLGVFLFFSLFLYCLVCVLTVGIGTLSPS